MGSTALAICQAAYRRANIGSELQSFSTSQEYPYDIAIDLINQVVSDINYCGDLYFMLTETALSYSAGVYQYDLPTSAIDPRRIFLLRREATDYQGELTFKNWRAFKNKYRRTALQTKMPSIWSVYKNTLDLDSIPDQDYSIVVDHFKDIDLITATTDTFSVPSNDEVLLKDGVYAYLLQAIGRPDFNDAYALYTTRRDDMRIDMRQNRAGPNVMPAAF